MGCFGEALICMGLRITVLGASDVQAGFPANLTGPAVCGKCKRVTP